MGTEVTEGQQAAWGLPADPEVESQWVWQISLPPLLHVNKEPAKNKASSVLLGADPAGRWVVDWDAPLESSKGWGPEARWKRGRGPLTSLSDDGWQAGAASRDS